MLRQVLRTLLQVAIPLAGFATGLQAPRAAVRWLLRQPSLLARSLVALLVIVPVGTVVLTWAMGLAPVARAGVLVAIISIGMGPIAAYRQGRAATETEAASYQLALNVTLLVVAIAFIPGFLALHGALFHHGVRLAPGRVAGVVLTRALIPLAAGVLVARLVPRIVEPVGRYAARVVNLAVLVVVVLALVATGRSLLAIGGRAWLGCALVALGAGAVGEAMGGPDPGTRRVLARSSALRFPALALLIASAIPDGRRILPVVLAYVLASTVVTALVELVETRRAVRSPARPVPQR
jgi:BASS family bile acid:Na+ symporter